MELSLDAEARQRYGVPEWIACNSEKLSAREMATIQLESRKRLGAENAYNTPKDWAQALIRNEPEAVIGLVWTALRRAGVDVAYGDVDFEMMGWSTRSDEPEPSTADGEPESGKGDGSATESPASTT